jgi:hypothetical protein
MNKIIYNGHVYYKHTKQPYYYCSDYEGMYSKSLHRQMWFDKNGEIPAGYHIHHINGDSSDNRIENLEAINGSDHLKEHMANRVTNNPQWFKTLADIGRPLTKVWHASNEGIEWHKKHAAANNFGKFDFGLVSCKVCGSEFTKKTMRANMCSNKCRAKDRRLSKKDHIDRVCKCCSNDFKSCKYTGSEFCSRKCSRSFIQR